MWLGLGLLASGLTVAGPALAQGRSEEPGLDLHRVSGEDRRRLLRGETLGIRLDEGAGPEIATGLALYLPVLVGGLADLLAREMPADPEATAAESIPDEAGPGAFARFAFTSRESPHARDLLAGGPGSPWNLSTAEWSALATLRGATAPTGDGAPSEALASEAYRGVLRERWRAYRSAGLAGIAPYARRGGASDPAGYLRAAARDAAAFRGWRPGLEEALLGYPAAEPAGLASRFWWSKRPVQGRPAAILTHQLLHAGADLVLSVERQFFVGHTYNAAQRLLGGIPFGNGTLLFAADRVSTDQVAGFGSEMKRALGRRMLRAELARRLEALRRALAEPATVQSP
jgi:hypothetical protein